MVILLSYVEGIDRIDRRQVMLVRGSDDIAVVSVCCCKFSLVELLEDASFSGQ